MNSRIICISVSPAFYTEKFRDFLLAVRSEWDYESRLLGASSGKLGQAGCVREDRPFGSALSQYHDDGERIDLSARQVSQRSVRSGEALLRLGYQQQRNRQPTAE